MLSLRVASRYRLGTTSNGKSRGRDDKVNGTMAFQKRRVERAFLLAGGRGERLRPLTLSMPKCLVPINGTPLLAIWLDLLGREGVQDVLVNVSHHAEPLRAFLASRNDGPRVSMIVEESPLGSAGTVAANRDFVAGEENFWILYSDNLTNVTLAPLIDTHCRHDGVMTLGLFHAPEPRAAGIVALDADGRVSDFVEKPTRPRGNLANAGIYLARSSIFDHIPSSRGAVDFAEHVLPRLLGQMHGHVVDGFLMDVGTPSALDRAVDAWMRIAPVVSVP